MKSEAVHAETQLRLEDTAPGQSKAQSKARPKLRSKAASFKVSPNLCVVLMGLSSAACVYFVGAACLEKIYADMRGEAADTTSLFLAATVLGIVAEFFGAAYFYVWRKRRAAQSAARKETKTLKTSRRKKQNLGPVFVFGAMLMVLLPIQFSVLSIWVTHKMS